MKKNVVRNPDIAEQIQESAVDSGQVL